MRSVEILKKIDTKKLLDEITHIEKTVDNLENAIMMEMKDFTFSKEKLEKYILEEIEDIPSVQHKLFVVEGERDFGVHPDMDWCGLTPEERKQLVKESWGRDTMAIHDIGFDKIHRRLVGFYRMAELAQMGALDVFRVLKDIPVVAMTVHPTEPDGDRSLENVYKKLYAWVILNAMECKGSEWFYNKVSADIEKHVSAIRKDFINRAVSLSSEFKLTKKLTDEDGGYW